VAVSRFATLRSVLTKIFLTPMVAVAGAAIAVAAATGPAIAHDCRDGHGLQATATSSGDHHGGDHDQGCPPAQPTVPQTQLPPGNELGDPGIVVTNPASTGSAARSFAIPSPLPNRSEAGPKVGAAQAGLVAHASAGSSADGLSLPALVLAALAVVGLPVLVIAGFRARRRMMSGIDAGWPRA
jgi:hypothetical protein